MDLSSLNGLSGCTCINLNLNVVFEWIKMKIKLSLIQIHFNTHGLVDTTTGNLTEAGKKGLTEAVFATASD